MIRISLIAALAVSSLGTAFAEDPGAARNIVHLLDRLGYGPRPGDIERVAALGVPAYIDRQLHPEQIEDSTCDRAIARLETLTMSAPDLTTAYFADIRDFIARQQSGEGGGEQMLKLRYGIDLAKVGKAEMAPAPVPKTRAELLADAPKRVSVRALGELQTAKVVRAVESERQLQEVLVDFWSNHFNINTRKDGCRTAKVVDDREVIRPHVLGKFRDLLEASAKSPAMLAYLDNKDNSKPREMSVFEQQMRAAAVLKLTGTNLMPADDKPKMDGGLNENYGREILELHTLGVDGGYTQKDVQEVARCFTGWGVQPLTGLFEFRPRSHDDGEKTALGVTIPAGGGQGDGEKVLDLIAAHPATAKHLAFELCQRFVSDEPPAALVDRIAAVFQKTDGDLREVVKAIVTSPEFSAPETWRAKIKSPLEFAVSSVRALGGHIATDDPSGFDKARWTLEGAATLGYAVETVKNLPRKSLNWRIAELGQPLFAFAAPTGWPEDSRKWVSAGALIARLNFALDLTSGKILDVVPSGNLPLGADLDQPEAVLERTLDRLIPGGVSPGTEEALRKQLPAAGAASQTVKIGELTALVLGSPEFQRR